MSEAKNGCASLEDTDEHTFLRFSQYVYTGDYSIEDPEQIPDDPVPGTVHTVDEALLDSAPASGGEQTISAANFSHFEPSPVPEALANTEIVSDWNNWSIPKIDKKKGKVKAVLSKKSKLWNRFQSKNYPASKPSFQVWKYSKTCDSYAEVLLDHARLYVFAEKYDIVPLRFLSLRKLHQALIEYHQLNVLVADSIVDLIKYSYSNTAGSSDGLRLLVINYAACVVEDLAHNPGFHSLLEQSGSAAKDLIIRLLKRLD